MRFPTLLFCLSIASALVSSLRAQITFSVPSISDDRVNAPLGSIGRLDSPPISGDNNLQAYLASFKASEFGYAPAIYVNGSRVVRGADSSTPGSPGDPAPGTEFRFLTLQVPLTNASGGVAFSAVLGASSGNHGIWATAQNGLGLVARHGFPAPGTIYNFSLGEIDAYNNLGQVAFDSQLQDAPSSAQSGVWVGGPGNLQLAALQGAQAPGFAPGVVYTGFGQSTQLNDAGQVAFFATTSEPLNPNFGGPAGVFVGAPGAIELVARNRQRAPETGPDVFFRLTGVQFSLNAEGALAFATSLQSDGPDPNGNGTALYVGKPGALRLVARTGMPAPGLPPGAKFDGVATPALNSTGEVFFRAYIKSPGSTSSNESFWVGKPGQLRMIAQRGDPAPGTGGATFGSFDSHTNLFSDSGQVAFLGYLDGTTDRKTGLFATDKAGVLRLVARFGDSIQGSPAIQELQLYPQAGGAQPNTSNGDGRRTGFDAQGRLAFMGRWFENNTAYPGDEAHFVASFAESAPVILPFGQPVSIAGVLGGSVTFQVTANGSRPVTYQWKFKGDPIIGATNSSLTLTNLAEANRGDYTVVVTNNLGSLESAAATLSFPPVITIQPVSTGTSVGSSASFAVTASGPGTLSYQWEFAPGDSTTFTNIAGGNAATLTVSNATLPQAGRYRVRVSNVEGSVTSAEALLTVAPAGSVVTVPVLRRGDLAASVAEGVHFAGGSRVALNNTSQITFEGGLINAEGQPLSPPVGGVFAGPPGAVKFLQQFAFDPNIGDSGAVVMMSSLLSFNNDFNEGLLYGTAGEVRILAQEGMTAPGTTSTYSDFGDPSVNASGTAAFVSGLGFGFDNASLFIGRPDALQLIARVGADAPGAGSGVKFKAISGGSGLPFNDSGVAAFVAFLEGGAVTEANDEGIWLGGTSSVQRVVQEGTPAPGVGAGVTFGSFPDFEVALNNAGQVAFVSTLRGTGIQSSNEEAIFAGAPTALQLVARKGMVSSGQRFVLLLDQLPPLINANGQVLFAATVEPTEGGQFARSIWRWTPGAGGGTLKLIARDGQQAAGLPTGITYGSSDHGHPFFNYTFNGNGQVAFQSFIKGPGVNEANLNHRALWLTTPGGDAKLVARQGSSFDTGGGVFKTLEGFFVSSYLSGGDDGIARSLSENGDFIFSADYGTFAGAGLFRARVPASLLALPVATTREAIDVTKTAARLRGTVNPSGSQTTAYFEYGTTTSYGQRTPDQVIPAGSADVNFSADVSGLTGNTLYHFRLVATNSNGTTQGSDLTFTTTTNASPIAGVLLVQALDTITPGATLSLTFEGWIDPEGDSPLNYSAELQGTTILPRGTARTGTFTAPSTPGIYEVVGHVFDSLGNATTVTQQFEVVATGGPVLTTVAQVVGGDVPGAGAPGSVIPAGAKWASFGIPSVNDAGSIAFVGQYASSGGSNSGLFLDELLIAAIGGAVPDGNGIALEGVTFESFSDPVLSNTGHVAFKATVAGSGVIKANRTGIWRTGANGSLHLVARTGVPATGSAATDQTTGAPASAAGNALADVNFKNLLSFTISGDEVMFIGQLKGSRTVVNGTNDLGIWSESPGVRTLRLREGQTFSGRKVVAFAFQPPQEGPATGSRTHVESPDGIAMATARVTLDDGSEQIIRAQSSQAFTAYAVTGQPVDLLASTPVGADLSWKQFGLPDFASDGSNFGFAATLIGNSVTKRNDSALFAGVGNGELSLALREGQPAPGANGAVFGGFREFAVGEPGSFAVLAQVKGGDVSKSNATGIWWRDADALKLLARQGEVAPGTGGATFKTLGVLRYAAPSGPLFVARLAIPKRGQPNPGEVSSRSDVGLWAVDSSGALRLVTREGQQVGNRTISEITVLNVSATSAASLRGFNNVGTIVYRATFTDNSTAIIKAELP